MRARHVHAGGVVCGQTLMAAADTALVLAISHKLGGFRPQTTVQLQTSFLRPVGKDVAEVAVEARILKSGRSLVFGEVTLRLPDGQVAAHATSTSRAAVSRAMSRDARRRPPPSAEALAHAADLRAGFDYRTAFEFAPIGLVLSRHRLMIDCNRAALAMFRAEREQLIGQSFRVLYPTQGEYERTGERIVASLDTDGRYADERVMRRVDGELFWCHVWGHALDAADPHAAGIWSFEDLSSKRSLKLDFTAARTRDRRAADRGPDQQDGRQAAGHQPAHGGRLSGAADAQGGRVDDGGAGAQAAGGLNAPARASFSCRPRAGRPASATVFLFGKSSHTSVAPPLAETTSGASAIDSVK